MARLRIKCELCGLELPTTSLARHLRFRHSISNKEYYDKFIRKPGEGICPVCGKETTYLCITKGYRKHCSLQCKCADEEFIEKLSAITKDKKTKRKKNKTIVKTYGSKEKYHEHLSKVHKDWIDSQGEEYKQLKSQQLNGAFENLSTEEIKEIHKKAYKKTKRIKKKKYGDENYNNKKQTKETRSKLTLEKYRKEIKDIELLSYKNGVFHCRCNVCKKEFDMNCWELYQRHFRYGKPSCSICYPTFATSSVAEMNLKEYIKSVYNGPIIDNDRQTIKPKELDAYLPDLKLAFEFDGSYWHADSRIFEPDDIISQKSMTAQEIWDYDEQKIEECRKIGIELIRIKEYDWLNNRSECEKIIKEAINDKIV